jgi:hypothetical protein
MPPTRQKRVLDMTDDADQLFRLDDDTWRQIKKLSGLTDTTRSEIEFLIDRLGSRKKSNDAKILKSLKATHDQLSVMRAQPYNRWRKIMMHWR